MEDKDLTTLAGLDQRDRNLERRTATGPFPMHEGGRNETTSDDDLDDDGVDDGTGDGGRA